MEKKIIGRKEEIKTMLGALHSAQPELLAVIGRRRVGKTFLIKQTYGQYLDFELTGLQHTKKPEQLQNFIFAFRNHFPDFEYAEKPNSWLEAFYLLSKALEEKAKTGKMVVFLDELPWLGSKRSEFITGLSWFWNSWAINQSIVVVICGSAASWMIEKVINDRGGLHNRVTRLMELQPFTLAETEEFLQLRGIPLSRYHIVQLYLTMGGIPMYLDQVKPGLSAVQNIQAICFQRNGYLRNEFDRLFGSLFDNPDRYIEIIRTLAAKRMGMTRQEIIAKSKLNNGGMLSVALNELQQSGFIEAYGSYGKKNRQNLYRLTDAYSLFYLTFIEPLGSNAHADFTKLSDLPHYKSWSGYAFENLCLLHIPQIRKALGISGVFTTISSFLAKADNGLTGAQIDLVIDRNDYSVNLCEIKFSSTDYALDKSDVTSLENKKRVFQYHTKTKKHLFTTLITSFGVAENVHRSAIDQVVVMDDLFK